MLRRLVFGSLVFGAVAVVVTLLLNRPGETGTPVISLRSSGAVTATIGPGTPLLLDVFINGIRASSGPSLGGWLKPWHALIIIRTSRDHREAHLPMLVVGEPRVRELVISENDGAPTFRDGTPRVAALDGMHRVFRLRVAATPEATAQLASGNFAKASDAAEEWSALDPDNASSRVVLGDALLRLGQLDSAREAYERALEIAYRQQSKEPPIPVLDRLARLDRTDRKSSGQ